LNRDENIKPFAVNIDFNSGKVSSPARIITRRLSNLDGLFYDQEAYKRLLNENDTVLYEVNEIPVPNEEGHLLSCTTVIYPGKVGQEYFFTKGHFHTIENRAEIYTCIRGEGYLLMTTRGGETQALHMKIGTSAYIPPYWAHRTLNCGEEPFIFHGVWPADSGHDYDSIVSDGFKIRVFEERGTPVVKNMP